MDGFKPIEPVMPLSTTAAPHPATASTASGPAWICVVVAPARSNASRNAGTTSARYTATCGTWNSAACLANSSTWAPPAANPTTVNRSRWRAMTSNPWVPMEPVDPRMTTVRF